ncbi:MAG: AAA family ATPase [Polyangiales bacterium]
MHDDDELAPLLRRAIDDVRVTSVALSHFKNIRSLQLDFPPAHSTRGHWTCIAGINGAGKSAVLQAITLALLGDRLAAELGGDRLQRARRVDNDGPHDASIALSLRTGQGSFRLALDLDASGVADRDDDPSTAREMRAFWKARPQHHLLRAYGPGRNLSEYIDKRYADRSPHVQAVMTLFDPLTQVASAEAIVEKAADAGFLEHLVPLVNHLFQDLGVTAIADGASLRFASQGATLAAVDLPDGLRATLAWVADLCFAWYAIATPEERAEGFASMRATVLVDEIDLHLHPKLQRTLVTRLRERLPRVQWIVTTHSPLVLASFDREEIVLLEPDPENGVRRRPLDRQIMGFTLDEIVSWLMETAPHSAALDAVAGAPVDPEERLAFLLSLSPTVGEREAREALDVVRERATGTTGEPPEGGS